MKLFGSATKAVPNERPMPPCGDKETHYEWVKRRDSLGCPLCAGNKARRQKRAKEDDYIDRLAKAIARELKEIL